MEKQRRENEYFMNINSLKQSQIVEKSQERKNREEINNKQLKNVLRQKEMLIEQQKKELEYYKNLALKNS